MRIQWCWRCRREVPMVDEAEWELIERARYRVACGFGMEDLPGDVPPLVERRLEAFEFIEVPW